MTRASPARSRSNTSGPTPSTSSASATASRSSTTARLSPAPTTGGRRGSSSTSERAVDARELADLISSGDAVPASGWVAGVTAALGAALVAKAASRSDGWGAAAGAQAQAADLQERLLELAAEDAQAYQSALEAFEQPDS